MKMLNGKEIIISLFVVVCFSIYTSINYDRDPEILYNLTGIVYNSECTEYLSKDNACTSYIRIEAKSLIYITITTYNKLPVHSRVGLLCGDEYLNCEVIPWMKSSLTGKYVDGILEVEQKNLIKGIPTTIKYVDRS